ncbi:Protein of unknown function DUF1602 [Cynara cardunculus var. scolymus]|uniref:Uncharacterized protein n=1 Tax=Cynara cardunculus var. scolymus TaxID=59895 RepID=A0A103YBX0_CYNCS|nr:Protein of unknown function DUF1602 [Cynara cardunculus var. scolymus]
MVFSIASWTIVSDLTSNALVASSNSKMAGFFRIARAIAILCFCPPDNCMPLSPQTVSYPSFMELHTSTCSNKSCNFSSFDLQAQTVKDHLCWSRQKLPTMNSCKEIATRASLQDNNNPQVIAKIEAEIDWAKNANRSATRFLTISVSVESLEQRAPVLCDTMIEYDPQVLRVSSSCEPDSITSPDLITTIKSAWRIAYKQCAMTIRTSGFIQKQDFRFSKQCPCNGNPTKLSGLDGYAKSISLNSNSPLTADMVSPCSSVESMLGTLSIILLTRAAEILASAKCFIFINEAPRPLENDLVKTTPGRISTNIAGRATIANLQQRYIAVNSAVANIHRFAMKSGICLSIPSCFYDTKLCEWVPVALASGAWIFRAFIKAF